MTRHENLLGEMLHDIEAILDSKNWIYVYRHWDSIVEKFKTIEFDAGHAALRRSVCNRLTALSDQIADIERYHHQRKTEFSRADPPHKLVIYTAITDRYDSIKLPHVIDCRFDYVVFSDEPQSGAGLWKVQPVTTSLHSAARASRYVKMHPHTLLRDYDVAIWVDANIMIVDDIYPLVDRFIKSPEAIGAIPHPVRRTIYQEIQACIGQAKDAAAPMKEQVSCYRRAGFQHDDLVEANVLMFKLADARARKFLNRWWSEMERGSKRDQLGFNYALRQTGANWHRLMQRPLSARNHPYFALVGHDHAKGPAQALIETIAAPKTDPYRGVAYAAARDVRLDRLDGLTIEIVIYLSSHDSKLKDCLESVLKSQGRSRQRIVVIIDGPDDTLPRELAALLTEHKPLIRIQRNATRLGCARSLNAVLADSTASFVVLLSAGTIVTDLWAEKMADAVFSTPGAGLAGPLVRVEPRTFAGARARRLATATPQIVRDIGRLNLSCERGSVDGLLPRVPALSDFCLGIRAELFQAIGLFDDQTFGGGPGFDVDYCFRAADAGFDAVVATHTVVHHARRPADRDDRTLLSGAMAAIARKHDKRRLSRASAATRANPILAKIFDASSEAGRETGLVTPTVLTTWRRSRTP